MKHKLATLNSRTVEH